MRTLKRSYIDTAYLPISWIIMVRILFHIRRFIYLFWLPKYEVTEQGVVLELDFKNKRFRRIFPDITEYVADLTVSRRHKSYHGKDFYIKSDAIEFCKNIEKDLA